MKLKSGKERFFRVHCILPVTKLGQDVRNKRIQPGFSFQHGRLASEKCWPAVRQRCVRRSVGSLPIMLSDRGRCESHPEQAVHRTSACGFQHRNSISPFGLAFRGQQHAMLTTHFPIKIFHSPAFTRCKERAHLLREVKKCSLLTQVVSTVAVFAHACNCASRRHSSGSCHITLPAR